MSTISTPATTPAGKTWDEFESATATQSAERDRLEMIRYRELIGSASPTDDEKAEMLEIRKRHGIDRGAFHTDIEALARAAAFHNEVTNATKRWSEIEAELARAIFGRRRLKNSDEKALFSEKEHQLYLEQTELLKKMKGAAAGLELLRREHPRVSDSIKLIAPNVIPKSADDANPELNADLAFAVAAFGTNDHKARYLRRRGVAMIAFGPRPSDGGIWRDGDKGAVPLNIAFQKQLERDCPHKDLLSLLATEIGLR